MSQYTAPPPSYAPKGYAAVPTNEPGSASVSNSPANIHAASSAAAASRAAMFAAEEGAPRQEGDADPDDFKFGVVIADSTPEIRSMFLRKVYGILFCQLLATTVIGATMSTPAVTSWLRQNQWAFIAPLFGSIITMLFLYTKRHSHPTNLILLGVFTGLEAFSLGAVTSYLDERVVLQALVLTTFVFIGLTLIVFVTDLNFTKMGPYLLTGLLILLGAGLVQMFMPFSKTYELAMAIGGCVIFSGFILYDTHVITKRLSSEEWVWACISLYLDVINLFISILRVLNGVSDDR